MRRACFAALLFAVVLSAVLVSAGGSINVAALTKGDGQNNLDLSLLQVGDIVLTRGSKFDYIIPGYWTHTMIYIGNGWTVEATSWEVKLTPATEIHNNDEACILRVATSSAIKQSAVNFALAQLGKPYDVVWVTKQVYGSSYYCSELAWASYLAVGGPDIDANPGWSWTYAYGVAPQEIFDDADTYLVAWAN
ncbi:MAG: YiiX/YebB-like N1pC/P60 family cysteine hydrolase [Candidatus Jordarchaeales archaeon]